MPSKAIYELACIITARPKLFCHSQSGECPTMCFATHRRGTLNTISINAYHVVISSRNRHWLPKYHKSCLYVYLYMYGLRNIAGICKQHLEIKFLCWKLLCFESKFIYHWCLWYSCNSVHLIQILAWFTELWKEDNINLFVSYVLPSINKLSIKVICCSMNH